MYKQHLELMTHMYIYNRIQPRMPVTMQAPVINDRVFRHMVAYG